MHEPLPGALFEHYPAFWGSQRADALFGSLKEELSWRQRNIRLFGKIYLQPRLIAFHGDSNVSYTYSGQEWCTENWTNALLEVKRDIESLAPESFNTVLGNRYRSGQDSMGWHSDNEPELGPEPLIVSANFGEARRFKVRAARCASGPGKGRPTLLDLQLGHGDLLLMRGRAQSLTEHSVPRSKGSVAERVNLTFRRIRIESA